MERKRKIEKKERKKEKKKKKIWKRRRRGRRRGRRRRSRGNKRHLRNVSYFEKEISLRDVEKKKRNETHYNASQTCNISRKLSCS